MTPERWQKIEALFQAAADRAPGERDAYLSQALRRRSGIAK